VGEGVRIAVVGCGAVAGSHVASLRALRDARCSALFDIDPLRAEAFRRRHDLHAEIVDGIRDLADRADVALVATPNGTHAECALHLISAGLHVLCEKPLATTSRDARAMVDAADSGGRILVCGLVRRFFPSTALVRDILARQLVGEVVSVEVRESLVGWPMTRANFERSVSGGGVLIDTGPHVLDLLAHLMGPLTLVSYADDARGGVESTAKIALTCGGGVPVDVLLTRGILRRNVWRVRCMHGAIEFSPHEPDTASIVYAGTPSLRVFAQAPHVDPFEAQWRDFLAACASGARPAVPARDAIGTLEIVEACYRERQPLSEPWAPAQGAVRITVGSPPPKRIFLTGATGRVGSRLVELWAGEGRLAGIRCLVRSYSTAQRIMRFPVEVVDGDLRDFDRIRRALEGCDAVVHLGAGEKPGAETEPLVRAALGAGVGRFVHMSSACVYGLSLPRRIERSQEETPVRRTGELYADGKAEAERVVLSGVARGLPAVILRPQVVYGPGMRWSEELAFLLGQGRVCVVEDGGIANLIYIDDLIESIRCTLSAEVRKGETFFVTDGQPCAWRTYIEAHAQLLAVCPAMALRAELLPPKGGLRLWFRLSVSPLLPLLRSQEFRDFILRSPLMQATVWRTYLALRERTLVQRLVARVKRHSPQDAQPPWSEHWIALQLSEARLSAARAATRLGFRARVDFAEGVKRTAAWLAHYDLLGSDAETPDD
jgi:predicted dehydrogenase/nucleoside-diphosphate-sugar epimerase